MKKSEFIRQYFVERFNEEPTHIGKTTAIEKGWKIYNVMSKKHTSRGRDKTLLWNLPMLHNVFHH